jgi:hypothetical protein
MVMIPQETGSRMKCEISETLEAGAAASDTWEYTEGIYEVATAHRS